jgi:hypothetical protein
LLLHLCCSSTLCAWQSLGQWQEGIVQVSF